MKLVLLWKNWYAANKLATILVTIGLSLAVVGTAVAVPVILIHNKNMQQEITETEETNTTTETKVEVVQESPETEISQEEYYEEELELDDSTENVEYQEKEPVQTPEYPYYIMVNRQMNTVTIYSKDESGAYTVPIKSMVCSCGLNGGTPLGVFKTSTKYEWRILYGNVYGQYAFRISGPIMFHSVPYYTMNKGDLESEEYNKLGEAASLGCIRLAVRDAKWLVDNCPSGTTVEIYDSPDPGPLGKPSAAKIDLNSPCRGWDPTDPDPANPWSTTGPSIYGANSATVERGSMIDILAGVTATSVAGDAVGVTVTGEVNVDVPGVYGVDYSATDGYGNTTTVHVEYTIVDTQIPTIAGNGDLNIVEGAFDITQLENLLKNQVVVADGIYMAEAVMDVVDYENLCSAIQNKISGTYPVKIRARDESGNESEDVVVNVIYTYVAPQPETEQPQSEIETGYALGTVLLP